MESGQMSKKDDLKVDIPSETEVGVESHHQAAAAISGQMGASSGSGLSRQTSITKTNCLCSPTTHVGSFRCRLHRAPSLQRTKSIDSKPNSATTTSH